MKPINESIIKVSEIIKALGHPVRIQILNLLSNKKNIKMSVKEIQERLGLTQPETSRHLIIMKNGSVIQYEKQGNSSHYFINANHSFVSCISTCVNKFTEHNRISVK
ncbi:MAG: metalloregulator ArsR/SmtB family transcription factor [Bacteroidota bacterium]|nr:metalloregulator ArsR/SmtB family transcription factor [Bacteroidota bacterium]MDP3147337.1 metalloregulator ArsR/SmtB family transcription factor [Bacteroidota bacterium]